MKKLVKIFSGLLLAITILTAVVWQTGQDQYLKVYFFDVGQGDAILIRTPSHQNIVIDGGPDNGFVTKLGQTLPFYDRTIDLMILTHPHDDHLFGLVEVLKRYKVKQVLSSGVLYPTDAYGEWLSLIKEKHLSLKIALAGQKYIFNKVELKVIYPFQDYTNQKLENLHEAMVVTQLIYHEVKLLFTGDLESRGEAEILKNYSGGLGSQILKVGHHGSDSSSGEEFLRVVSPKYAVILVGQDNDFGHPSFLTLKRLERLKIRILRTDLLGDVIFWSDGRAVDFLPHGR